jgi:hypothetical protein
MQTINGFGNDARRETLAILERADSAAGVVHVHALDDGEIVDILGVVSAGAAQSDVALKVGRVRRYPGTHCRSCGAEVRDAVRELVAL